MLGVWGGDQCPKVSWLCPLHQALLLWLFTYLSCGFWLELIQRGHIIAHEGTQQLLHPGQPRASSEPF